MANIKVQSTSGGRREIRHRKRPGVIAKCRTSKNKNSKHYVKPYRGQGR